MKCKKYGDIAPPISEWINGECCCSCFSDQPERLNPETLDTEKDDAMADYYGSQVKLTVMR